MTRDDADAEARRDARRLVAEAESKLRQEPDEIWLGRWIGEAWTVLEQLGKEPA